MTEPTTEELVDRLKRELAEMANCSATPMGLWDRFSNGVLLAAQRLSDLEGKLGEARKEMADVLVMTGCRDREDLEDMARCGKSLLDAIAVVTERGPFKGWCPADDPAEIVTDMLNEIEELESKLGEARKVEQPHCRMNRPTDAAAWVEIERLFGRYRLPSPPYQLRDELVTHLMWARYGEEVSEALKLTASGGGEDNSLSSAAEHSLASGSVETAAQHSAGGREP